MDTKKTWYFTFGCGHALKKHVQPIRAKSAWHARLKMFDMYGQKWADQYDEKRFREVDAEWGPYARLPEEVVTEDEAVDIAQRMEVPA